MGIISGWRMPQLGGGMLCSMSRMRKSALLGNGTGCSSSSECHVVRFDQQAELPSRLKKLSLYI